MPVSNQSFMNHRRHAIDSDDSDYDGDGDDRKALLAPEAALAEGAESAAKTAAKRVTWCAFCAPRNRNRISLFWEEKLYMLVEFAQIMALMRALSPSWPWPPYWRKWTRHALLCNLDYAQWKLRDPDDASRAEPAVGAPLPRVAYAWFGAIAGLLALGWLSRYHLRPYHRRRHLYWRATRVTVFLSELLYLPALLVLPRLLQCEDGSAERLRAATLSNYPGRVAAAAFSDVPACGSAERWLLLGGALLTFTPFLLGLPLFMYNVVRRQMVYAEQEEHEGRQY